MANARSGIDTQLGVAEESTFGTFVTPGRYLEFLSEALKLSLERNESKGLRSAQKYLRTDHWQAGKRTAAGDIQFEVGNKGFGLLFKHALGAIATTADGAGKKHTATPGDLFGKSLSVQVGRPDVGNTIQPYSYTGAKVASWGFDQPLDDFLHFNATFDAQDESTSQTLGTTTAPAETELFHWSGCALTVGGSAFDSTGFSFTQDNGLNTGRHHLRGSRLKKEPIENAMRNASGNLSGEFESLTAYNRFVNGTIVPIVATWTAVGTYDTAKPFKLVLTLQNCRFDGDTPTVGGPDVLSQSLPFKVLDDGTNPVVQIDYYTSDTTP